MGAVVIIADDDRAVRDQIAELLGAHGAAVVPVVTGQMAVDAVRAQPVDLVVVSASIPGLNGIDACRAIKATTKDRYVPIMLLTAPEDLDARGRRMRTGADDHLSKPCDPPELITRIAMMLQVKRAHDDVQSAKKELQHESFHYELGVLPDRRDFHERLQSEFDEARRHLDPLACCIIAVEELRRTVEEHGADFATQVLAEVSARLRRTVRATDIVARFRTTEFGLLLPNTRPAKALALSDRLVAELALRPLEHSGVRLDLTMSIGIGVYPSGSVRSHAELLDAASIAVARARVAGPNRVCLVQQQGYVFHPTLPGAA